MKELYRILLHYTVVICLIGIMAATSVAASEPFHTVKPGESLWSIAQKYQIDVATLARLNQIERADCIPIGMKLKLREVTYETYTVQPGDALWLIARKFGVQEKELIELNRIQCPDLIHPGMKLKVPTGSAVPAMAAAKPAFFWPTKAKVTSKFGWRWGKMHEGIDFGLPVGTQVAAAKDGKVVTANYVNGYGLTVIVEHAGGYRTLYAHLSKVLVKEGQWVATGQLICKSGNTGKTTGPNLHFEIQKNGKAVNPLLYLN